jgi:hypothetical protein
MKSANLVIDYLAFILNCVRVEKCYSEDTTIKRPVLSRRIYTVLSSVVQTDFS